MGARYITLYLALALLLPIGCSEPYDGPSSLEEIQERGHITMITHDTPNNYYVRMDNPAGFEYELARRFSQDLGVELKVITTDWGDMIPALQEGRGDFIAAGLPITEEKRRVADFSDSYMTARQKVIVHRDRRGMQDIQDLEGEKVHVLQGSAAELSLQELKEKRGIELQIEPLGGITGKELLRRVAQGDIETAVTDSNTASYHRRFYPHIRTVFPVSEVQSVGWAVHGNNDQLLQRINSFKQRIKEDGLFDNIYEHYYAHVDLFDYVELMVFHRRMEERLPHFVDYFKKYGKETGFDWKLLAALAYQESHWSPHARSFTGVRGLMQVTQRTAREMGITDRLDPEQSVRAGARYLRHLYDRWETPTGLDKLKFALASYNIGYSHVVDAQRLARQHGLDPSKWSSMSTTLPKLGLREYYSQTRFGYARGSEPVHFVRRIMKYYSILQERDDLAGGWFRREAQIDLVHWPARQ